MKKLATIGTGLAIALCVMSFNNSSAGNHPLSASIDDGVYQQDTMHKKDRKMPRDTTNRPKRKHDSTRVSH